MRLFKKINLFVYIIIFSSALELTLQAASSFIISKTKKQNLTKGGDFNILCVGDSFTYGIGAPAQDSYPKQLERLINKTRGDKYIHVINLGVSGYNSSQCLDYLKKEFDSYNPKIVLNMSGLNNCWNFINSSYFKIKQYKQSNPIKYRFKLIDAALSRLRTYKVIKIAFLNVSARLKSIQPSDEDARLLKKRFPMPKRTNELTELLNQGIKYFEEGKYDLSEVYFSKALQLFPNDYEPHWFMGRLYNFKSHREKGRKELILAAKYAPHPYILACILADMQDRKQPKDSKDFQEFSNLIKEMKSFWVEKFGEEYVALFINPVISCEEKDLSRVLIYDLEEMSNYLRQRKAQLVILTYPHLPTEFRYPADIYYRIHNYVSSPLVDNVHIFNKYLKIYRYEQLFSADGHCTSKGYELIANNVYEVLKKYNLLPSG